MIRSHLLMIRSGNLYRFSKFIYKNFLYFWKFYKDCYIILYKSDIKLRITYYVFAFNDVARISFKKYARLKLILNLINMYKKINF